MNIGDLVRLVGDPSETGAFQGEVRHGPRVMAKVQFRTGIRRVPLDQVEPVPAATEEPVEFLRTARFGDLQRLRQVLTHVKLTGRLADVIYSMEASDTEFHAHQFKPVLKMMASPTGGLLIADEVGLGKTIESALIWTELRARFDYSRLLVVCPKVLCAKWSAELSGKFSIDTQVLGPDELLSLIMSPERMRRGFAAICSLQSLQPPRGWDEEGSRVYNRASSKLARVLRDRIADDPLFDLAVVDEAHHLRNPETQRNVFGNLLRPVAQHKVFLSATPIQLRSRDLFSLLRLLDPDTFRREEDLAEILTANRPLIAAREALLKGAAVPDVRVILEEALAQPLLRTSQQLTALKREIGKAGSDLTLRERAHFAGRLDQVNLLSSVVNRTRRRDVQEFRVVRQVYAHVEPMSEPEDEVYQALSDVVQRHALKNDINAAFLLATPQRMLSSCLPAAVDHWRRRIVDFEEEGSDEEQTDVRPLVAKLAEQAAGLPSVTELEANDSKFARFLGVIREFLADTPGEKVVVFSTFRPTLRYLERRLAAAGLFSLAIHGDTEGRDDVLQRFAEDDEVRILLSSEVGSEGLDLQFCRTIINYDLPWNPMRVEQRIGRIDRMGQASPTVTVINLLNRGTIDQRIYERLYERLDLCSRALGDFEAVLGEEISKLTAELLSGRLSPAAQEEVIAQTALAVETRKKITEELEEEAVALMAHGDQVLEKIQAAKDLNRWVSAADIARYVHESLTPLYPGSVIRDIGEDDLYEITLTAEARFAYGDFLAARGLPRGSRLDRDAAPVLCRLGRPGRTTRRRRIESIGQSHPFIRFLAEKIADSEAARLRPAVAARLSAAAAKLPVGRYSVLVSLWRFGGAYDVERVVYSGLRLSDHTILEPEAAEAVIAASLEHGEPWPAAAVDIDCAAVADMVEDRLSNEVYRRFSEEEEARRAEHNDRAAIQLANLERHYHQQKRALETLIDEQRRRGRVKGSVIAANEGKLRKLTERMEQRRRLIEGGRVLTSQQEALLVLLAEVV